MLTIVGREASNQQAFVVHGRLRTANLTDAPVVGQCMPDILSLRTPWKCAAGDMAKRVESFCRETYDDLKHAQAKRTKASN